jgi:hypothetical protein
MPQNNLVLIFRKMRKIPRLSGKKADQDGWFSLKIPL